MNNNNQIADGSNAQAAKTAFTSCSSPGQGRSLREIEEQLASLRKENFNLKLRIYFLEERPSSANAMTMSSCDAGFGNIETLTKHNIDLKV
jgi:Centrosomin N-terminal motif 1